MTAQEKKGTAKDGCCWIKDWSDDGEPITFCDNDAREPGGYCRWHWGVIGRRYTSHLHQHLGGVYR